MTNGWWDFRSPNLYDMIMNGNQGIGNLIRAIFSKYKSDVWIADIQIQMEAPDAEALMQSGCINIFDGTTTEDEVDVKSADVKDNGTTPGVGLRSVTGWGFDENDKFITPKQASATWLTNGTGAVSSTEKWKRINGVRQATVGAEGDPAGAVTIHEDAGVTETYYTIAAGTLASISSKIFVPTGYNAIIGDLYSQIIDVNHADIDHLGDDGYILRPVYDDEDSLFEWKTTSLQTIAVHGYLPHWYGNTFPQVLDGGDDAYIGLYHATKANDRNITGYHRIRYIIWGD
jgi:hypothetical protein